jgi:hypothetical protein
MVFIRPSPPSAAAVETIDDIINKAIFRRGLRVPAQEVGFVHHEKSHR